MTRVSKFDNSVKKRRVRREHTRQVKSKGNRVTFLIICEGKKTEPNYFKALKKELPDAALVVADITIEGTGRNTESLIDFVIQYKKNSNHQFDRIWAVFDRDSFSDEQFNNAIKRAESNQINCAWSNEAFELWFLLHFQLVNHAMSRADYKSFLEREIKRVSAKNDYIYKKNDINTYSVLTEFGNQAQAINWAKELRARFMDRKHAGHNPCTLVYLLIEELFNPAGLI